MGTRYRGYWISPEFVGIGKPPLYRATSLMANGVTLDRILGEYLDESRARLAVDERLDHRPTARQEDRADPEFRLYGYDHG